MRNKMSVSHFSTDDLEAYNMRCKRGCDGFPLSHAFPVSSTTGAVGFKESQGCSEGKIVGKQKAPAGGKNQVIQLGP
jgi:hypothetical protein